MPNKAISDLPAVRADVGVTSTDLFVLEQNATAKKLTGEILVNSLAAALDGHGGIASISYTPPSSGSVDGTLTLTFADGSTASFTVTNGNGIASITQYWAVSNNNTGAPSTWYTTLQTMTSVNRYLWSYTRFTFDDGTHSDTTPQVIGVYGDTGNDWHVFFRYAEECSGNPPLPASDASMLTDPDDWIGIYSGTAATAPTTRTSYTWYKYKGERGITGNGIASIDKTATSGTVDTYTIYYSDGNTSTFTVTNGSSIATVAYSSTSGLVDTYTVTLTNGQTSTFNVTNAKSIVSVTMIEGSHSAGQYDKYRITFNDGDTFDFTVYNGANGQGSVSTVSGIQAANGDVPQVQNHAGAPTTASMGVENQLWYDTTTGKLYFCLGESGGTYVWQSTGVTIDSALSTSSTNPVQNKVITGKVGTATLTTTAQNLSGAVNEHDTEIGNVGNLTTTATDLAGAVNELDADIGSTALPTTAQTLSGAIAELDTDKVDHYVVVADNTDLNTLTTSGFYRLGSGGNNLPTGADGYSQLIVSRGQDTIAQIFVSYSNAKMFVRSANNLNSTPSWKAWKELTFNDGSNISSASDWKSALGISNKVIRFVDAACSAITGDFCTISDARITANHYLVDYQFGNPAAIVGQFTWTTAAGSVTLNGTCSSATSVTLILVQSD